MSSLLPFPPCLYLLAGDFWSQLQVYFLSPVQKWVGIVSTVSTQKVLAVRGGCDLVFLVIKANFCCRIFSLILNKLTIWRTLPPPHIYTVFCAPKSTLKSVRKGVITLAQALFDVARARGFLFSLRPLKLPEPSF